MKRDSLFNERIIWTGRPAVITTPPLFRAVGYLLFILAAISVSSATVIALALHVAPTPSMLFAAWCLTLGAASWYLPPLWLRQVEYIVTEQHVIWQRGLFKRTIERTSISFSRIYWSAKHPGTGDLEVVRAVPTGALRRRLMLRLNGLAAPDRVWAIIRGAEDVAPAGHGARPLAQRLDVGERVLWSARPAPSLRAYLPHGRREWSLIGIAGLLLAVTIRTLLTAVPALQKVVAGGLPVRSFAFVALVFTLVTTVAVVVSVGAFLVYSACVRPGHLVKDTRYLVTDKRVLIQRGSEELHLDRGKIVEVIDAPKGNGLSDVFIVLDGPRARALAASGAFGETDRGPNLRPVFESVADAESVSRILLGPSQKLPEAA